LTVWGDGSAATVIYTAINTGPLINLNGEGLGTATKIKTTTTLGASSVSVASTTGFAAETYARLMDSSQHINGNTNNSVQANVGEIIRVLSVETEKLNLRGRLDFGYTGEIAEVQPIGLLLGVRVSNMSIKNPTPDSTEELARAVTLSNCGQIFFDRVHFFNLDADALRLQRCVDFVISNCYFNDMHDAPETETAPYSIECVKGTSHGLIYGCLQRYGRHLTTFSGSPGDIASAHIVVADCSVIENHAACFDTHPGCRWITFANCEAHNSGPEAFGFQIRGIDCAVINPTVSGCQTGIYIVYGADRCRVSGGRISGCEVGISIRDSDDARIDNVLIDNPIANGVVLHAEDVVYENHIQKLRIRDVEVTGNPSGAAHAFELWRNGFDVRRCTAVSATTPMNGRSAITVASAATLAIPGNADEIEITGTTNITAITADQTQIGRIITLIFTGVLNVEPGTHLIMPKGKLTTAAGTVLTLVTTGTSWYEVTRSV
jgi:Right handed beta helix region